MKNNKLNYYTEEYNGRCYIIPCCDLVKFEEKFNQIKDDIIEAFMDEQIISSWNLKDGIIKDGEVIPNNELEDYANEDDYIWNELICRCMKRGYIIIYESPVPKEVKKDEEGNFCYCYSWGYYQTYYIHLEDLSQLTSILKNIDDEMKERSFQEDMSKENGND